MNYQAIQDSICDGTEIDQEKEEATAFAAKILLKENVLQCEVFYQPSMGSITDDLTIFVTCKNNHFDTTIFLNNRRFGQAEFSTRIKDFKCATTPGINVTS